MISLLVMAQFVLATPTPDQLMKRLDDLYRFESSQSKITMTITTPDWTRTLKLQSWSKGLKMTFIRILSPAKDAGVATLRMDKQMWNYFPKIDKVMKVPPSMMMGSWMGSDFTNDDLVRETSYKEEYDATVEAKGGTLRLITVPKPNVPTVWGKIITVFDEKSLLPTEQEFFDEKGVLIRTMVFSDLRNYDGKTLASKMTLVPKEKKGHKTEVVYDDLKFTKVPESIFSLQNLRKTK